MDDKLNRIVPLDQFDEFEVAEGDPDVRGWEVISSDGRKIGEVEELLVDTDAMKVRYLDVDLNDDLHESSEDRHVLIPIGYARLDREDDQVLVEGLTEEKLRGIPAYNHEPITPEYESSVAAHYDPSTPTSTEALYSRAIYDDRRFYGTSPHNPLV